jgi:transcriptional regulator with XRE-family HTH domain
VVLKAEKPKHFQHPRELSTLGDHIRKRRLDLGLFQKQLAGQIGTSEDTIYRWESNESSPQVQFIPAILKFLDYNPLPLPDSSADKIVFYRQVLGLSQRRLAKQIGIDPKALGLSERGRRPLPKKLLKFLESVYSCVVAVNSNFDDLIAK